MARSGLYKSDVQRARDSLRAEGKNPSVDAVRVALGNTGSKTTIHRYLKELEEEEGQGVGAKIAVSDALQDLVARLAERLHAEADALIFASDHYFWQRGRLRFRLPRWLVPGATLVTHQHLGRGCFAFDLKVTHPLFGELLNQHGLFRDA